MSKRFLNNVAKVLETLEKEYEPQHEHHYVILALSIYSDGSWDIGDLPEIYIKSGETLEELLEYIDERKTSKKIKKVS